METELTVVLLRPKEDGNVGAVARIMSNFGVEQLVVVKPRASLGDEARRRSMAGLKILKDAKVVPTFAEAVADVDLVVGTTDLSNGRTESYLRRSVSPEEWGHVAGALNGKVAILFGPEDNGLNTEELARCDVLISIPTNRASPTLNLSHAAAIVLYATFTGLIRADTSRIDPVDLNGRESEVFLSLLDKILVEFRYPRHKRRNMRLLYRRLLGRAVASEHEYAMLLGLFRRILYKPGKPRRGAAGRRARGGA
jgi:TrmH family RNA methyltransferase